LDVELIHCKASDYTV